MFNININYNLKLYLIFIYIFILKNFIYFVFVFLLFALYRNIIVVFSFFFSHIFTAFINSYTFFNFSFIYYRIPRLVRKYIVHGFGFLIHLSFL